MKHHDFISLFAGAGGLDLGLELAGWRCRYATDIDQAAVDTMKVNQDLPLEGLKEGALSGTFIEQADVRDLCGADILGKTGLSKGEVPLLAGGPPCQSWSSAGHQHGLRDPRGQLFVDFLRIAGELDMRWVLFENVRGLLTARGPDGKPGSALQLIRQKLLDVGFQSTVQLLNAADYGVPQRRVRLFIIGYREGDTPAFPVPTHTKSPDLIDAGIKPWVSLGDCLDKLQPPTSDEIIRPTGKMAEDLADIPAGSGVKSPGKKERTRPGGHWGYKQGAFVTDPSLPSRTITASGQQDWIRDPRTGLRRLCPRECASIQTFPENWIFDGKTSARYRLIGNAVPPVLAMAIGKTLARHIANHKSDATLQQTGTKFEELAPLPPRMESAIAYTMREERSNGASRKSGKPRRTSRIELVDVSPQGMD